MTDERRHDDELRALIDELERLQLDPALRAIVILLRRLVDNYITHTAVEEEFQKRMMGMVPDGDIDAHRRYHEALIRREERRTRMVITLVERGLLVAAGFAVLWIGQALYEHAADTLRAILTRPAEQTPAAPIQPPAGGKR